MYSTYTDKILYAKHCLTIKKVQNHFSVKKLFLAQISINATMLNLFYFCALMLKLTFEITQNIIHNSYIVV